MRKASMCGRWCCRVARPLLSITMPTRNRAELLEGALGSVLEAMAPVASQVEVTVSDGSDGDASGRVVRRMLPGAGAAMIEAIGAAPAGEAVLVSGAEIVDQHGVRKRSQRFGRERYLEPGEALRRLLRNSSFVREPMVVVRRTALEREGLFDTTVGGPCDTDMWVRLFSRYGIRCLPRWTCAYTIHEGAATTGMWNPGTIRDLGEIFDRAVAQRVVPERTIRRWQADFLHQFILAGAYRRLRRRRRAEAREVLRLLDLPEVRRLGVWTKWLLVRAAFSVATVGARAPARPRPGTTLRSEE